MNTQPFPLGSEAPRTFTKALKPVLAALIGCRDTPGGILRRPRKRQKQHFKGIVVWDL